VSLTLLLCACDRRGTTHDGFEGTALTELWNTRKLQPGAVQFQSTIVRTGTKALAITLRPGDQVPEERGSVLERAELEEAKRQESTVDTPTRYAFSLFLPSDFPIVPTRLVLAQWKQRCELEQCTPDNPTLAIRYERGELFITHQTGAERRELYRTVKDVRNRWLDFRFEITFSRAARGIIRAWLGDEAIVDYGGVNAYPEGGGYNDRFYFKWGLYRDRMATPMTIYLDEYDKQTLTTPR
jgi:hypothetical protein